MLVLLHRYVMNRKFQLKRIHRPNHATSHRLFIGEYFRRSHVDIMPLDCVLILPGRFSTPEALREIHRVLRPGAVLGLIWNVEDYNKPQGWEATTKWEQKLNDFVWSFDDGLPRFRHQVCNYPG